VASDLVNIDVSTDGGASWSLVARGTPNDGLYEWVVDCDESGRCMLRIRNAAGTISDVSQGTFSVELPMDFIGCGSLARARRIGWPLDALLAALCVGTLLSWRVRRRAYCSSAP
jgi:hypothetical protein